jgi:hypothetical protein
MSRYQRGGPNTFQKPENALKRAEELVAVGQRGSALQTLHDVITSKRHRTWQKVLEQIMFRYLDLCVELKKGRYAKDGLIHYRNVCQQVNVSSLEEVIKYFLKSATDKAEDAQSKAAEARGLPCGCCAAPAYPAAQAGLHSLKSLQALCVVWRVAASLCACVWAGCQTWPARAGPGHDRRGGLGGRRVPRGPHAQLCQRGEGQGAAYILCIFS